ncbi:D-ribose pyranase [Radiobacillus kanasensis]|uniref:D-ribose pyranase n=1 Tax=Radiobacillus kanasensis TaxID=2844358 RepID=UPI001E3F204A|nr:D-ribose pyranase [Radiobacillus kanasensis]UFT98816.1 D-ribose pyranase [Radiobacillus kanasensis]
MKKHGILNSEISRVLSKLGHTDQIVIADCGLPIPDGVKRIDLALKLGSPSFHEVFSVVLDDMEVEKMIFAEEIKVKNLKLHNNLMKEADDLELEYVPHEDFKRACKDAKVVIRTGEASPYANVLLQSGVIF